MSATRIVVCPDQPFAEIHRDLYGHFAEHLGSCIYDGICVGEHSKIPNVGGLRRDVIEALKNIQAPVLRWPGGCFADDYHWDDGVGPRANRPRRVNIWWGDTIETNEFGTHEFLQLCNLIGAKPYLSGNVGSGSPRELRDWVEYCNFAGDSTLARRRVANGAPEPFKVHFWGVGNENWGCGGNFCPEDYAAEYKRFATYMHNFPGAPLYLIACGPDGNNGDWTRRFFSKLGRLKNIHGYSAHYYCGTAGTATEYTHDEWYHLLHKSMAMETLVKQQRAIMDGFDPDRKIGLVIDEWGTWHPPAKGRNPHHLWQQNTLRDALVAALTLDIFNRHAEKVVMANIAQTLNVLQALILTDGEKMLLTPTYHVYDMYKSHQGARSLRTFVEAGEIIFAGPGQTERMPALAGSASMKDGAITLSVVNPHASAPVEAEIDLRGTHVTEARVSVLSHGDIHAHNTFDAPDTLAPRHSTVVIDHSRWRHTFEPASVTVFSIQ